jgi:mono/diheme cytochrome c family protein
MRLIAAVLAVLAIALATIISMPGPATSAQPLDGKAIFRFDTFGDEQLWTDTLRMHEVIAKLPPATALTLGLKVDSEALPPAVVDALKAGKVDLNDPAVTVLLLQLNAVVGVVGKVSPSGDLKSVGITCALCHSTVDNSFAPGIGKRLDGWPNLDLDVGAIVAKSPAIVGTDLEAEFNAWGPGKYDPRHHAFDGTNLLLPNTPSLPVVIPPAYGLQGVGFETFTGDGPISYWNSYVGVSQMGGHGSFTDPRIGLTITQTPDLVTPKLPALFAYQLSLESPPPPAGSFNELAALRGQALFNGKAGCSSCHNPQTAYTDVGSGPMPLLHDPTTVGQDPTYAQRSATAGATSNGYRTTPLRALWQHPPYFHDGSAPDLSAVVEHYDQLAEPQDKLNKHEKADLVEFLKSI